ncbi:hypothetical protein FKG95_17325 [Denitrobaculum tricleocarpae]|uniref:Uncharacterized protein n=1 Tax=Denitrobaculum tricleocarpae TaxID=2591009 RepID=A0A545TM70_9PROT|nr:hypothetical protein FKG95_17325 [Denitrobaculum tricleocarpae]
MNNKTSHKGRLLSSTTIIPVMLGLAVGLGSMAAGVTALPSSAYAGCSPCAAKKACNPCNPCAAKKACNPCAAKNPCNPCNPCAAKNPCNPCAAKTN